MKIYINLKSVDYKILEKLNPYLKSSKNINTIYSDDGIFRLINNKLMKLKIVDEKVIEDKIDGTSIVIDKSKILIDAEYYQLPMHHFNESITEYTYELNKNAYIKLIIKFNDKEFNDLYFILKDDSKVIGVNNDFHTFLSLLNFNTNI